MKPLIPINVRGLKHVIILLDTRLEATVVSATLNRKIVKDFLTKLFDSGDWLVLSVAFVCN